MKWIRRQDALVGASCAVGCLISGLFVSRPGIYWFALWDAYVVWAVFIVVGIECVGVAYGYGASKFAAEVQKGAGRAVPRFIQMCWSFITPFLCSVLDCVDIKFYGAFVLNRRVDLHAIDATPARWRGDVGSSPLDGASAATSSPRNDVVKNCRCLLYTSPSPRD